MMARERGQIIKKPEKHSNGFLFHFLNKGALKIIKNYYELPFYIHIENQTVNSFLLKYRCYPS